MTEKARQCNTIRVYRFSYDLLYVLANVRVLASALEQLGGEHIAKKITSNCFAF